MANSTCICPKITARFSPRINDPELEGIMSPAAKQKLADLFQGILDDGTKTLADGSAVNSQPRTIVWIIENFS